MTPSETILPSCICGNPKCSIPYGTCHCGCRLNTPIANRNVKRLGLIKGRPVRYVVGHHVGLNRDYSDQNTIVFIDGIECRRIPLTKGYWALVDVTDFDGLSRFRWYANVKPDGSVYAYRNTSRQINGIRPQVPMHRQIMGLSFDDSREVDHVEPSMTLDNRRSNLRIATHSENGRNTRLSKINKSGRKGVSWRKDTKKWHSAIGHKGKSISLGDYDDYSEACHVREEAEKKYHGEFARSS